MHNSHTTQNDTAIIGVGPIGLFTTFQYGMAGLKCHIIDPMDAPGGQCIALYPEKPIYDIPGFPKILTLKLIKNLTQKTAPFAPKYHMGKTVNSLEDLGDEWWQLTTSTRTIFNEGAIIITAGFGAFEPKRPPLNELDIYKCLGHGAGVNYFIKNIDDFSNKNLVIAGGGNSVVDWALTLVGVAKSLSLVHCRNRFRAQEASLKTLPEMVDVKKSLCTLN